MKLLKNPVLYIVIGIFLFVGGVYWAFEYKMKKALAKPDDVEILETWELSEDLMEISGISYLEERKLACVQDEEGIVFVFDLDKKEVVREIDFKELGDYEGIAVVEEMVYVLRSDGTIWEMEIPPTHQNEVTAKKYEFPQFEDYDIESLDYDKKNQRLLFVPKENAAEISLKKVYAFNLVTKKLESEPVFEIDLDGKIKEYDYGNEVFDNEELVEVEPADMAVHPITGKIYIIDSENHIIIELSPLGKPLAVYRLNSFIFKNPEGICFTPQGEMYISSEGSVGLFANIWRIKLEEPFQIF